MAERQERNAVLGPELLLPPMVHSALASLGVLDRVRDGGVVGTSMGFSSAPGEPLDVFPLPGAEGGPAIAVTRPHLLAALRGRGEELGVEIRYADRTSYVGTDDDRATVRRSGGSEEHYDLVIGADGVFSEMRATLFPEAARPPHAGQGVWRARINRVEGDPAEVMTIFKGPERRKVGVLDVGHDAIYVFMTDPHDPGTRFDPATLPAEYRMRLRGFGATVDSFAARIEDDTPVHFTVLHRQLLPAPWSRGRAALIGEAAHAVTPHIAYGAELAIEDGVVLAECVTSLGADVPAALHAFMDRRFRRCADAVGGCALLAEAELHPDEIVFDPLEVTAQVWRRLSLAS